MICSFPLKIGGWFDLLYIVDPPGVPAELKLNANTTCVSVTVTKPDNPNGIITSYKVKLFALIDSDISKMIENTNGSYYLLQTSSIYV